MIVTCQCLTLSSWMSPRVSTTSNHRMLRTVEEARVRAFRIASSEEVVDVPVPLLVDGPGQIGADGLLGRMRKGVGSAVLLQLTPDMLSTEEETYLRFSAWRITRALAQIMSNMGARFRADEVILRALGTEIGTRAEPYCPGYREDFSLGDDPYRYKRW